MTKLLKYIGKDIQDITLESWFAQKPEELRPFVVKWLNTIYACGVDVQAIFHDGYPMGCIDDAPFAYVNIFKAHVNVGFFYGSELSDKNRLLVGKGKRMRHIKLTPYLTYDEEAIVFLIESSYSDIKQRLKTEKYNGF